MSSKTIYNNINDIIDEILTDAKNKGVIHLFSEDKQISGKTFQIKGKTLQNFGSCGYLGLETDERLIEGAVEAVRNFGTQFSLSRNYITNDLDREMEELVSDIYQGAPVIISSSTSTAHITAIPNIVKENDLVILDQQVHFSVQTAVQLLRPKGIPVEMIRHNNLAMLEEKIESSKQRYSKVWYMIDGVYSMFGDFAPVEELIPLMEKYPQLYLYIDDAHGMSWAGKHGSGYIMSQIQLHPRIVLVGTLAKGFGINGGIIVFPDAETCRKVRSFGGPQSYSHPLPPPTLGAGIASAKIHLSTEIYSMQNELAEKIYYCDNLLREAGLPVTSDTLSPIFFIAMGLPRVGYNMVKRILDDGFYVNIAIFPVVSVKNTGVRFTITRHHTKENIYQLVQCIKYHFPKVLEEEGKTQNQIRVAFKLPKIKEEAIIPLIINKKLKLQHERKIVNVDKALWDSVFESSGSFDWEGIKYLEESFTGNPEPEYNWDFHYYLVKDEDDKLILATFFTAALWKDDMLSNSDISKRIEELRQTDPYYLTSKVFGMGSFFTEGDHLYIDRDHNNWQDAMKLLLETASADQDFSNASILLLRDFYTDDEQMKSFLINQGFIKVNMPPTHIIDKLDWNSNEEFLKSVSRNSRKYQKKHVLKYEDNYEIEIIKNATPEEIEYWNSLFLNVRYKKFEINIFGYPIKAFEKMVHHPNWEIISLKLKPEIDTRQERIPVSIIMCYKNKENYIPLLVGIDYDYLYSYECYRQALYQAIKRGKDLHCKKIRLGFTASDEKKRFNAKPILKSAYLQVNDNFNMELIELMDKK